MWRSSASDLGDLLHGAVVPNATISVKNVDTSVVIRGEVNSGGAYCIPYLRIGKYELTVEATGFKKYVRIGLCRAASKDTETKGASKAMIDGTTDRSRNSC
jgi:hypothetical protein